MRVSLPVVSEALIVWYPVSYMYMIYHICLFQRILPTNISKVQLRSPGSHCSALQTNSQVSHQLCICDCCNMPNNEMTYPIIHFPLLEIDPPSTLFWENHLSRRRFPNFCQKKYVSEFLSMLNICCLLTLAILLKHCENKQSDL